ncbi:MAG: type II secretion system F family protein, partial [Limisphaerales bacterium]
MPKYSYVALDAHGKESKGTIEVASQNEAISRVKEMGFFPTKIAEASEKVKEKRFGKKARAGGKKGGALNIQIKIPFLSGKVKPKVLTTFTRQLATLVDAGLPLLRGLRVLEKQERNATLKGILSELALAIEGGSTFSEALAQHPKVFNRLFVNMVKAGELGGVLEVVLKRLAEFSEKAQKIKGKVKAAMFYPIAVMIVAIGILILLMVFIIPRFQEVFANMGFPLPKFTLFVLAVSNMIKNHFLETSGIIFAGFIVFLVIINKTKIGRRIWDKFKLKMPVLG